MTKLFVFHLNEDGCWQNYSYSIQTKMAAGKIICISFEQKHISVKQKRKERATLHNPLFVCKFRVLSEPYQLDASGRTISLFGYNNFRQILFL
mgnify:FL=1